MQIVAEAHSFRQYVVPKGLTPMPFWVPPRKYEGIAMSA
jgi:hypothetical protein